MPGIRTSIATSIAAIAATSIAFVTAAAATATAPEPMEWWGLWTGRDMGSLKDSLDFVAKGRPAEYGTNLVFFNVDDALADVPGLKRAIEEVRDQGRAAILALDGLLWNGCDHPYGEADYAEWDAKLEKLATGLGSATSGIAAIIAFDDVNGRTGRFGCLQAAPGQPSPVTRSLVSIEKSFPGVRYRGHVWQVGDWDRKPPQHKNPEWLIGSTMLFPYSYRLGAGSYDRAKIGPCPPEESHPNQTLPAGSFPAWIRSDLAGFVRWVNDARGNSDTPVLYVGELASAPDSTSTRRRDQGCAFAALWTHLRCDIMPRKGSWAKQLVGGLAFSHDTFDGHWLGIDQSPEYQIAARWVGTARSCTFSSSTDFVTSPEQGARGWHSEECAVTDALDLSSCTDMRTFRGGAWRGSDLHSLIWSQGMHPPADTHRAVARAWRSPFTGTVRLSGTVSDQRKCAETDGIRIAVFKNATRLWGWTTIADGSEPIDLDVTTTVAKDDAVRLVVHPGAASGCDQTATDLTVVATW